MYPFDLIHYDVWMPVASVSGFRYYVLFTDDFKCYTWIFPMCHKSKVFKHVSNFFIVCSNSIFYNY